MDSEIELAYKSSPYSVESLTNVWKLSLKDRHLFLHGAYMMLLTSNLALLGEFAFLCDIASVTYRDDLMLSVQGGSL